MKQMYDFRYHCQCVAILKQNGITAGILNGCLVIIIREKRRNRNYVKKLSSYIL